MGAPVDSTRDPQKISELRVYPGADAAFTLYNDDGLTYAYEDGKFQTTELKWDDASGKLSASGAKAWGGATDELVKIAGK
jgi:alpha-D-xyloside xylohydrolase